jgi:hypothetical protein
VVAGGLVAAALLVLGGCGGDAERTYCGELEELDQVGALASVDFADGAGLREIGEDFRSLLDLAPPQLREDITLLGEVFDDLADAAEGDDPVALSTRLADQRAELESAGERVADHARTECDFRLGES